MFIICHYYRPCSYKSSGGEVAGLDEGSPGSGADGGGDLDIDDLFSREYVPDFKTKRSGSARGLTTGDPKLGGDPNAEEGEEEAERAMFVDWLKDYNDENEWHVPNRIGFSTADWGNSKKGFVTGKLKKKDRRAGKFNKADLRVSCV